MRLTSDYTVVTVFKKAAGDKQVRGTLAKMLAALVCGVIASIVANMVHPSSDHTKTYQEQLEQLDHTQQSLKQLMTFVEAQKRQLHESQQVLSDLQARRDQLKPVVDAGENVVNAVLDLRAKHERAWVWLGYVISFILGFFSSLAADLVTRVYRLAEPNRAS